MLTQLPNPSRLRRGSIRHLQVVPDLRPTVTAGGEEVGAVCRRRNQRPRALIAWCRLIALYRQCGLGYNRLQFET